MTTSRHRSRLRFKQHGVAVELDTVEGVFSASTVDAGSRLLLRLLADPAIRGKGDVLDLGCGYGPLGLWVAAADPGRRAVLVDRDALAVEAAAANAATNRLDDRVSVGPSLGWDDVDGGPFGLVVSNVPAKVGDAAIEHLLLGGGDRLAPGAVVAVVAVDRIAPTVEALLTEAGARPLGRRTTKGYVATAVALDAAPPAPTRSGFDAGVYGRGRAAFEVGDLAWEASTSRTLAEFDQLGHGTEAAADLLAEVVDRADGTVGFAGVGQGHLPIAARVLDPERAVRLVDRDLLALRTAAANLDDGPAVELRHAPRPDHLEGCAAVVVALAEKEPVAITAAEVAAALIGLPAGTPVVLHGRVADLRRVAELLPRHGVRPIARGERLRGRHGALLLELRSPSKSSKKHR